MSEKRDRLEAAGGHREFKTRKQRVYKSTYMPRKVSCLYPFMVFEVVRLIMHLDGEKTIWLSEEKNVHWRVIDFGTFELDARATVYEFSWHEYISQGFYSYD